MNPRQMHYETLAGTIIKNLARRRMAVARNMLLTTEESIAQIGEAVGYDNPTYFGMVFKKYEGITPTDCRKRHGTSLTW